MKTASVFCALVLVSGLAAAQVPTAERDALIALYNATDGAHWTNSTGWLGAVDTECTWNGVTCSGGRVNGLYMGENNLVGTIPPELGDLSSLQHLFLYSNQLTGSIPLELGDLSNLLQLVLYDNQLSGEIPVELMNPISLTDLDICDNFQFTNDVALQDWLDLLQPGWDECQSLFVDGFETGNTTVWSSSVGE